MIRKVLIADRGEAAVKVLHACAKLEIGAAVIFTDADRHASYVKKASEVYYLGVEPVGDYVTADRLVRLALDNGCDAIHPGYGFLAECTDLACACERQGVAFVGPPATVIRRMRDKIEARRAMQLAGVPVVPGSNGNVASPDDAARIAGAIGYPVMLKVARDSEGEMSYCGDEAQLRRVFNRVVSRTITALGRVEAIIEKAPVDPRRIHVQILADKCGNVLHLFERDCSIRHFYGKLMEVAPSPRLSGAQRQEVCALAVRAAVAVGYENAGTVEFLLDRDGKFYFTGLVTRLQAEHSITEQITGIDIVQEQIRIAEGMSLTLRQETVACNGCAIQFRIDPDDRNNGFVRSAESTCAKAIAWAPTWERAIARGRRALQDFELRAIQVPQASLV